MDGANSLVPHIRNYFPEYSENIFSISIFYLWMQTNKMENPSISKSRYGRILPISTMMVPVVGDMALIESFCLANAKLRMAHFTP